MSDSISSMVTEERIARMAAALEAPGATEPPPPPANAEAADDGDVSEEAPASEPTDGQPAAKPDPVLLKKLQDQIKELERKNENLSAMQGEAHKRNASAAAERRESEALKAQAQTMMQRQESMIAAQAHIMKNLPPELAQQFMASLVPETPSAGYQGMPTPGAQPLDPMVAQLKNELDRLKRDIGGFAFDVNHGQVASAIDRQLIAFPIFQKVEKAGELDDSINRVMGELVKFDQDNPGELTPHNPRRLSEVVREAVKKEADRRQKSRDAYVTDYRDERRQKNAAAPATSKGPGASVRSVRTAPPVKYAPNTKQGFEERVKRFEQLSRRLPASEI